MFNRFAVAKKRQNLVKNNAKARRVCPGRRPVLQELNDRA